MAIVGPTAVGKTGVAVRVCSSIGGEIISADSRQTYRGMDIGTAKPTPHELDAARHHLVDIIDPSERYDAARFARDAESVATSLLKNGLEPIVVGGTGFYVASLFEGLFEGSGRHPEIRARLEKEADRLGSPRLHERLAEVDSETAARLHPNDAVRVIRALEVHEATGRPLSAWHESGRRTTRYEAWYVVLRMDRDELYERIEGRVDAMVERGLVREIEGLLASGSLEEGMPAADALGYRGLLPVIRGERDLRDAVKEIKRNTRRFAKRQMTWFARTTPALEIDVGELGVEEAAERIAAAWCDTRPT